MTMSKPGEPVTEEDLYWLPNNFQTLRFIANGMLKHDTNEDQMKLIFHMMKVTYFLLDEYEKVHGKIRKPWEIDNDSK